MMYLSVQRVYRAATKVLRSVLRAQLYLLGLMAAANSYALEGERARLEYGTVLFDFHQQAYFDALVEFEYNSAINNTLAARGDGQVLKGGMLLSYSVPDAAFTIFNRVLDAQEPVPTRNRAWYYLAKLYYSKSETPKAIDALNQVQGPLPRELHLRYHYLATLIQVRGNHLDHALEAIDQIAPETPLYPYLRFNLSIGQLRKNSVTNAVSGLEEVARYDGQSEELSVLADRAKHGLAQLAIRAGRFPEAWKYLNDIRTQGLYSNRALLTYAWSAINLKLFNEAIPALELLNERTIAMPEVQEAKVLLAHLYEQEGAPRKALKANLLAEKAFQGGVNQVAEARRIIAMREVPREFIDNLEAIMHQSDWYSAKPSINYQKLTPFLIDLMASHAFNETLKELADLYAMENNLEAWQHQADQHLLILKSSSAKAFSQNVKDSFEQSVHLRDLLNDQNQELRLHTMTLDEQEQERFTVVLKDMEDTLNTADEKIRQLKKVKAPFTPPKHMPAVVAQKHKDIQKALSRVRKNIKVLEPVMRNLVNAELDKHEERMRYYWAQSRLAKARLYDSTLLELEKARAVKPVQSEQTQKASPTKKANLSKDKEAR